MNDLVNDILDKSSNNQLGKTCENLFFDPYSSFGGKIGVKNLGRIVSAPKEEFEAYLNSLSQGKEEEFLQ